MSRELIMGHPDTINYWPVSPEIHAKVTPGVTMESEFMPVSANDDAMIIAKSPQKAGQHWVRMCKSYSEQNCVECKIQPNLCPIKARL